MARPMPKNPPIATVSPMRISRAASRAMTIFPVLPDCAVGTIATLIRIPPIAGSATEFQCSFTRGSVRREIRFAAVRAGPQRPVQSSLMHFVERSVHEAGEHAFQVDATLPDQPDQVAYRPIRGSRDRTLLSRRLRICAWGKAKSRER
jgi:hypothetical protein